MASPSMCKKISEILVFFYSINIVYIANFSQAFAFDTPIHVEMTNNVLKGFELDRENADIVAQGNADTDNTPELYNTMHAHFCNEEFSLGAHRLRTKMRELLASLAICDRDRALLAMGTSLHAIQDFYAHSNAINVYENGETIVDLFHIQNSQTNVVCSANQIPRDKLTSAFWPDDGNFPNKCTHAVLAKDLPADGQVHVIAKARAVVATVQYIESVESMVKFTFKDSHTMLRFLKSQEVSVNKCKSSNQLQHQVDAWLPHLLQLMKKSPNVVLPLP